jgi:hypothetical protein
MLLGPGGAPNPPSNEIYDERGMLVWDRFTKTLLWGDETFRPTRESDGFLRSAHYLYNYSDVITRYWRDLTEEQFIERYGRGFSGFTKEPHFLVHVFRDLNSALKMEGVSSSVRTLKIARMTSSWLEKLLYVVCNFIRSTEPKGVDSDENSATKQKSRNTMSATTVKSGPPPPTHPTESEEKSRAIAFLTLKMKDILAMPTLMERLGIDRIYLLRTLVGPLHSINLRNLLWHGFIAPHEWPSYHTCFLFGILLSIATEFEHHVNSEAYQSMLTQVQTNMNFFDDFLRQTSPILANDYPLNASKMDQSTANGTETSSSFLLTIARSQREQLFNLVRKSAFCMNGSKSEWLYGLEMALEGRYFEALVIFFPLLEASLRRIYVEANNIQSFRLTAEPDTLCLSLDLVLEDWLDREVMIQDRRHTRRERFSTHNDQKQSSSNSNEEPDDESDDSEGDEEMAESDGKIANKIFDALGDNCGALFDLLIWADTLGLRRHYRPRDQLAHGSAVPSQLSAVNLTHLLLVLLNLMQDFEEFSSFAKGPSRPQLEDSEREKLTAALQSLDINLPSLDSKEADILKLSRSFIAHYTPCFHKKRAVIDNFSKLDLYMRDWDSHCANAMTPMALHLLKDAISKEMKKEDLEWAEKTKRRAAELTSLMNRLETSVNAIHRLGNPYDISKDKLRMFPIKSPISLNCLVQLIHTDELIAALSGFVSDTLSRFISLREQVESRTAWLTDRRNFAGLVSVLPVFGIGVRILLLIVKEILSHSDYTETVNIQRTKVGVSDLPIFLWTMIQRMNALSAVGKFRYAEEVLECLLLPEPKIPLLIGKGEGFRCWLDVEGYLWRLDLFIQGQPLLPYNIYKHPRNARAIEAFRRMHGGQSFEPRSMHALTASIYELFMLQHQLGHLLTGTEMSQITYWDED